MRVVPPPSKAARTARAWVPSAVLGTVLAIVIGAIAIVLTQPSGASVSIPQLVGLTQAQAVSTAAKPSDLRVSVKRSQFSDELKGTVLSQSPTAGAWSQGGDSISVVVSNGPKPIVITNVQGLSPETATAALEKQGFVVKTGDPIYSAKAADKGSVQKTDPAIGSGITPGSTVTIYASKGLAPVKVPNITGATTYADAAQMVTAAGFVPQQLPTNSDTVPSGGLIPITNPVAGTELTPGSPVQIQVSIGPALIPIPSYVGQTVTQATAALTALQMKVQVVNFTGNPNSKVKAQTPVNVSVPHQTSIQLIL
jgi:beta-lactam-binding protein with PASTA domain